MRKVRIIFPCGDIQLEGVWHFPESTPPFPAVIACHPHPLYGGSMSVSVVFSICQALAEQQVAALRFNFRGVGNSGGKYGGGIDEQEDVRAALAFVSSTPDIDTKRVGLVGYSFGAGVASPVAVQDDRVSLLAMVSPALSDSDWQQLKKYTRPSFIISGEEDFVIPADQLRQYIKDIPGLKECEIIPGVDHFWQSHEDELIKKVADFFVAGFKRS